MKPFLLGLALVCSAAPLWAQKPVGARAMTGAEMRRSAWPKFQRTANSGSTSEVMALQYLLRSQGFYKGKIDGKFQVQGAGSTEAAVKAFQRAKKLKEDGIVGVQTWGKLLVRVKPSDRGDAVRAVQTLLDVKVDGIYGGITKSALLDFQKDNTLVADGIMGPQTWSLLLTPSTGD